MRRGLFARGRRVAGSLFAVAAFALAGMASAQTDVTTSRVSGTVSDAEGAGLPGVSVEGKNEETGLTVVAVTDEDGFYRLLNLPSGAYTISATLEGFQRSVRENVRVQLGSTPTVNFTLQLGAVAESIAVTAAVPFVEVTNTAASTTIQTEQLKNLPSGGRDFKNLVLLTPETRLDSERGNLSISGERGINTNVTVDGADYNNAFFGGTVGGAEGRAPISLSQESIKEFSVITNGASVEFGRTGGGVVNVITKSGTNNLHGSAFYYYQPQEWIADFANGATPADQEKAQYGASLGGPILKDRLFFFGSYDRQDQTTTFNIAPSVLDPDIFARYPILESPAQYGQTRDGEVAFGRIDAQIGSAHRLMGRINYATYEGENGTFNSANDTIQHNGVEGLDSYSYVGQYSAQFGGSLLNDLTANYNTEDTPRQDKGLNLPEIQLGGARYGEVAFLPIVSTTERLQFTDTVTYLLQSHVLKAGADYNDTTIDQIFKGNWRGVFVFNNEADLLAGRYFQYRQFGGLGGLTADEAGNANFGQEELAFFAQDQWFVKPNLTVTAGVRWERLDNPNNAILNPNDLDTARCVGTSTTNCGYRLNAQIPDSDSQWSPRLGVSWAPDQKSVVRVTAGRYWSRTPAILFAQLFTSNGLRGTQYNSRTNTEGRDPTDPNCRLANGTSCFDSLAPGWGANFNPVGVERVDFTQLSQNQTGLGVFAIDSNFENPYTDRVTLGYEREIFANTGASIDFTYAEGSQLQRLTDANRVYDGTLAENGLPRYSSTRPNTFYGTVTTSLSDARSEYYAITGQVQRRFSNDFSAGAVVAYSSDKDTDSNERNFAGIQPEDFNDIEQSFAYSNRDQRWKLSGNAVWATPLWGISLSGAARYITGGTYTPRSNFDFNNDGQSGTDRPTVGCTWAGAANTQVTGADCRDNGSHLGRNSFRQPRFYSVDARVSKAFRIGPGELSAFIECFNCTDAANWSIPSANQTWGRQPGAAAPGPDPQPSATFGDPTTPGTPRTFQVALRFDF